MSLYLSQTRAGREIYLNWLPRGMEKKNVWTGVCFISAVARKAVLGVLVSVSATPLSSFFLPLLSGSHTKTLENPTETKDGLKAPKLLGT